MGNIYTVGPNESLVVSGNQLFINLFFYSFLCQLFNILWHFFKTEA
jgi:hypothetical protein